MKRGSVLNTRGILTTGRRPRAREHHKAAIRELLVTPVLVDVPDLDAAEEARLIIAATGRESVPGEAASMLYSDREARHMQRIDDAMAEQITAGQSLAIAEQIGHYDRPFVAVSGVQGGVGTSTLAVHLAAACSERGSGRGAGRGRGLALGGVGPAERVGASAWSADQQV